jgi:hypothetical protein
MGDLQLPGNGLCTFIVEVVHHQRHPEFPAKPPQCLLEIKIRPRVSGRFRRLLLPKRLCVFPVTSKVNTKVLGDSDKPLAELFASPEITYLQISLQDRILSHILGIVNIAQHAQAYGENIPIMPLDEQRVGAVVATLSGCNQNFI